MECQERKGETDGYRVVYYPTSDPSDRSARTITGTGESDRMFTVTGLPPRTNYTFEVQASNPGLDVRGAPAALTVSTTAPQGESLAFFVCNNCDKHVTIQTLVFSSMVSSILITVL